MKIVNLIQGSQEWLDFRATKIGASDSAAIMGVSPYTTPYQLWLEKTGRQKANTNPSMAYGHEMEDIIRQMYEKDVGDLFMPCVVQHPEYDFLIASLDGLNFKETHILEIKTCNKQVFEDAKNGVIPKYYEIQLQHQLMCTPNAEENTIVFWHKDSWIAKSVKPDKELQQEIYNSCLEFYNSHLLEDMPPEILEQDCILIEDNPTFASIALEWKQIDAEYSRIKKQREEVKKRLLNQTDDGSCKGYGVKIIRYYRKGNVDYSNIPELQGVDLNKYRKGSTYCTLIKEYKE